MRILLVDNYDSFTYNLFHQLAEVTGENPVVIQNDTPGWDLHQLHAYDAVVISPGPGTPERAADFGICRDIIEECDLPLLGICLGHQGIAQLSGGTVSRAPEPRHGRLSPVRHDGTDLFEGLPSPFQVVRYHSLTVSELPDALEATAWTPDGVLMALRHRTRPMWGVQFHPESICTEYGHRLLGNFINQVKHHHAQAPQRSHRLMPQRATSPLTARASIARPTPNTQTGYDPALDTPEPTGDSPVRSLRVIVEQQPTTCDDEVAFDRVFRGGPHAFWLDSSKHGGPGRFSIMGNASGPLSRIAEADVWQGTVTVTPSPSTAPDTGDRGVRILNEDFLDWLDRDLRSLRVRTPDLPFDFALGWVGYLGYELKAQCGGDRAHRAEEPDASMLFADRALVFDHQERTTYLLALAEDGAETAARSWLDDTAATLNALAHLPARYIAPTTPIPNLRLRHDRTRYLQLIAECQEEIAAGETYEVCLTNLAEAQASVDPWKGYQFLRRTSPAPFAALLQFGQVSVLSTSPERFIRVTADGMAESRPIKGTRPRGATPAQDAALREELLKDEKDHSENLMIVDLVRNDLGRCAEIGSVDASQIFEVESYATVHQLVSTVRARLRPDCSAVNCVQTAFPGGSMTGAPKIRTMQIIDRLEGAARGIYSGAIGYFSLSGAADLSIVIRTAVITPNRVRYGIGGAIVALSDPEAEFEETAVKSTPLLRLLGAHFPGRRHEPVAPLDGPAPWDTPSEGTVRNEVGNTGGGTTSPARQMCAGPTPERRSSTTASAHASSTPPVPSASVPPLTPPAPSCSSRRKRVRPVRCSALSSPALQGAAPAPSTRT